MAVHQNLARLSPAQLRACQQSAHELHEVVSFEAVVDDYLDLDVFPLGWEQAALAAGLTATAGLLERACEGDAEVNPSYRTYPGSIFEQPVSFLTPDAVTELALALRQVDLSFLSASALTANHDLIPQLKAFGSAADPSVIYIASLTELVSFYLVANERDLAVMVWWD